MATVYPNATLNPGKTELITSWLPEQEWYTGPPGQLFKRIGSYRFDDPDGAVGIETMLVRGQTDGQIYQVPMTYRDAPLERGTLMTTMEHSVLGLRHVYEGMTDPVLRAAFRRAITERGHEADQRIVGGDQHDVTVPSGVQVRGSGLTVAADDADLTVPHLLPAVLPAGAVAKLNGFWTNGSGPVAWLTAAG